MHCVQNWTLNKKLFNSFNDNLMRMQMVLKCMFELLALGQQLDQQIGITLVMALCVLLLYHFGNTLFRTLQPSSGSASNWWQSEILRMRQPTKFKSHLPNFCMQPCSVSLCTGKLTVRVDTFSPAFGTWTRACIFYLTSDFPFSRLDFCEFSCL